MQTLTTAQATTYLSRIGATRPAAPTLGALASLHRAHLLAVPFENLDIGLGRPIRLDLPHMHAKVVGARRGGYCYELNPLFAALLRSLGYTVSLVSARVAVGDGRLTDEFDHLALLVSSPLLEQVQLADVGFVDAFVEPIPLLDGVEHQEPGKQVGLTRDGERWVYRENDGNGWQPQYVFTTTPRALADFAARNAWQQQAPESHFTRGRVVSLATDAGRVTISRDRLIITSGGRHTERPLDPDELPTALEQRFGIRL